MDLLAVALAGVHFALPLAYYSYAKAKWLPRPWNVKIDENYKPKVVVIVPTYNEGLTIRDKLNNLYEQNYPRELFEIIVVDSASEDGTAEKVREWGKEHPDVNLKLLEEPVRRGMNPALNFALKHISKDVEIIIFTDADSYWPPDALRSVVKYFADPIVAAVTTNIVLASREGLRRKEEMGENVYRSYYNNLRVSESKLHSTPVHNGALVAFRFRFIRKINGIPEFTGNNDSTPASIIAFMGYRAIQISDVTTVELLARNNFLRKVRRAQHLLLSFLKTKRYAKKLGIYVKSPFDTIWRIEWWLHVINPWLLVASLSFLIFNLVFYGSVTALVLIGAGLIPLMLKAYRAWIMQQVYLIIAAVRNLWTREIMWSK